MTETTTDWQGRLRIGDLVRDALRMVLRQAGAGVFVPALFVGGVVFATERLDFDLNVAYALERGRAGDYFLGREGVLVAPLMAPSWLALAWGEDAPAHAWRERAVQAARAFALLLVVAVTFMIGGWMSTLAAIVIAALLALAVPVLACEGVNVPRALRRSVALGTGTRISVVLAWLAAQAIAALALAIFVGVIAFVPEVSTEFPDRALEILGIVIVIGFAGLRWGLTMGVCVAAYKRLSHARAALDPEVWLEVFR